MFKTAVNIKTPDKNILKLSKILIVDDDEFNRNLITQIFYQSGFVNIDLAKDGAEALAIVEVKQPDLIILDLFMPKIDGFEFCNKIRSKSAKNKNFKKVPILVLSATTRVDDISRAFEVGASDYINKPIIADELLSRSLMHLEHQRLLDDSRVQQERIANELDNAKHMQESIMPTATDICDIEKIYNMSIEAHFETSSELGGDLWGIKKLSGNELAVYTVDFSGHGVGAALNTFRLHAILQEQNDFFSSPKLCLKELSNRLVPLLSTEQFATMFYAVINIKQNIIRYATAGTLAPFLVTAKGKVSMLEGNGLPIGVISNFEYKEKKVPFSKGDLLMLYSDALLETENTEGMFLTESNLIKFLKENRKASPKQQIKKLLKKFRTHANNNLRDDLTINMYQRNST